MRGASVRRDANEPDIVKALRAAGCLVEGLSGSGVPDLLVWTPFQNRIVLLEVKDGAKVASARKLKPEQVIFHKTWVDAGAPVFVITNQLAALKAVGAVPSVKRVRQKVSL